MFVRKIIDKPLTKIGRAADMLWMGFGKDIPIVSLIKKEKRNVAEYALHFQCQWRFTQGEKILLASHDIYQPFDVNLSDDDSWDWDILGREKLQSSQFDVLSEDFCTSLLPLVVKEAEIRETGDLHICFEHNVCFDTFITYSRKHEFYRFIDFNTEEHHVIFDEQN